MASLFDVPEWGDRVGNAITLLTDRGMLIRIGTFAAGAGLVVIALYSILRAPVVKAAGAVAKVVV